MKSKLMKNVKWMRFRRMDVMEIDTKEINRSNFSPKLLGFSLCLHSFDSCERWSLYSLTSLLSHVIYSKVSKNERYCRSVLDITFMDVSIIQHNPNEIALKLPSLPWIYPWIELWSSDIARAELLLHNSHIFECMLQFLHSYSLSFESS